MSMDEAEGYQSETASTSLMESLMTGRGCVRAIAAVGGIELAVQAMINSPMNSEIQKKGCQALYCLANHKDPEILVPGEMPNDYKKMVIDAQGLVVLAEAIRLHGSDEDVYFAAIQAMAVLLPDLKQCAKGNQEREGDDDNDDDISSISQSKGSYGIDDSIVSSSFFSHSSNSASRTSTDISETDDSERITRRRILSELGWVRLLEFARSIPGLYACPVIRGVEMIPLAGVGKISGNEIARKFING